MRLLRTIYLVYSGGFIFFAFRAISLVLVSSGDRNTIEVGRPGWGARLIQGVVRAALWPILFFRAAGIRQLFRGE